MSQDRSVVAAIDQHAVRVNVSGPCVRTRAVAERAWSMSLTIHAAHWAQGPVSRSARGLSHQTIFVIEAAEIDWECYDTIVL